MFKSKRTKYFSSFMGDVEEYPVRYPFCFVAELIFCFDRLKCHRHMLEFVTQLKHITRVVMLDLTRIVDIV